MTIEVCINTDPDGAGLGAPSSGKQRNPSARHQALLELMKAFPETALRLVAPRLQLSYHIAGPLEARSGDTDARGLRMDARLEYWTQPSAETPARPVIAVIVEAQLGKEGDLRWRLCPYVGYVSHDCRCATDVIVLCGTGDLARKLSKPVMLGGGGNAIMPLAIGPDQIPVITNLQDAAADPGQLMLSAWYHTRRDREPRETLLRLLVEVIGLLSEIDPDKAKRYHEMALAILLPASARRLKEMTQEELSMYVAKKYYPEVWDPAVRQGRAEGIRNSVLTVLKERGITVPAAIRRQIQACNDLKRLVEWHKRSITAATAKDVIAA